MNNECTNGGMEAFWLHQPGSKLCFLDLEQINMFRNSISEIPFPEYK